MELGLVQKQTTNLVMTAELRQAISLLQYSTMELAQFIQEQALENPLIELEERIEEFYMNEKYENPRKKSTNTNESKHPLEFVLSERQSLQDYLLEQIRWIDISDREQEILEFLVLNVDDNGYLTIESEEAANDLAVEKKIVEKNIERLQSLEPVGVGARDFKECLLLQLKAFYPENELAAKVIENYIDLFANKKWQELAQQLNVSLHEINEIAQCIQTLQPKPCINIDANPTIYWIPDIIIDKQNDHYTIAFNDQFLPVIHINDQYKEMLNKKNECSVYLHEKYNQYKWLVKSIEQRRNTMLKIATVLVEKQRDFFENGLSKLHPLTLKEIAREIDMHESSVSRTIKNKVIQTPQGIFEMKQLFTSKIQQSDGTHTSSSKIKGLIKKVIDEEEKQNPLSDQKIVDYLHDQFNILISRRTVTKYRKELGILSSSRRKHFS
ncbi:RNA polymerase factor sigma-54 [Lederbergia sp. NSJ-179]|uniref:RNA polymerase factor sigma-54 n=1 Tax=Lederbergia sp. NSJ-179 TaxID=2931402 RepID=UPI001FD07A85|nr:RNA polymerase factor sigma-54 [Lederbergia sp. NSJ-179]MCJ7843342.1 RNA polymerase factor sigma-54 [Lederbergia sp. NSJ-179]